MQCPYGHEDQEGMFCSECGAKLNRPKLPKGPYKVLVPTGNAPCPGCGWMLKPFQNFCSGCGREIVWDFGGMRG